MTDRRDEIHRQIDAIEQQVGQMREHVDQEQPGDAWEVAQEIKPATHSLGQSLWDWRDRQQAGETDEHDHNDQQEPADPPAGLIDRLVRSVVIRDACPCGECAGTGENWVKVRAVALGIAPALAVLYAGESAGVDPAIWAVPAVLIAYLTTRRIARTITQEIERTGCRRDPHPHAGGGSDA